MTNRDLNWLQRFYVYHPVLFRIFLGFVFVIGLFGGMTVGPWIWAQIL